MNISTTSLFCAFFLMLSGCASSKPDEPAQLCELGVDNAVAPVRCVCPEGSSFEVLSRGWGPCPAEGMRDCPASVLICVETPPAP